MVREFRWVEATLGTRPYAIIKGAGTFSMDALSDMLEDALNMPPRSLKFRRDEKKGWWEVEAPLVRMPMPSLLFRGKKGMMGPVFSSHVMRRNFLWRTYVRLF